MPLDKQKLTSETLQRRLEAAQRRWQEAQDRLGAIERRLVDVTGVETDIYSNINILCGRLDGLVAAARAAMDVLPEELEHREMAGCGPDYAVPVREAIRLCNQALTFAAPLSMETEVPFSECVNPDCPIGCPDSHATPPSYWAMVDEDEPVVQEVTRG